MMKRKIKTLNYNPALKGMAAFVPDVVFSNAGGVELKMQMIKPWEDQDNPVKQKRPLIVFLQGSAWTFPDVNYEIPQLAEFARKGYVVATITHRNYQDGYPAPAFLQDAKTAIRFLRKNADEYNIDPNRICFWGTSSGGNTALLVALTGDDPRYKTEEYAEHSDSVKVAVACFGPTNLVRLAKIVAESDEPSLFEGLAGGKLSDHMELIEDLSPILILKKNREYPPILLLHGDADMLVPYDESVNMYNALLDGGYDAEMIRVKNAPHEHSFWSPELIDVIADFIERKI
ncbi:MAG: prolyl oligopeptidase family serine peptidase [Clostridiaceae bacterium]|nr:prolyl oligopeptidase family serine peptidase [Clostridiaceae bacterium]